MKNTSRQRLIAAALVCAMAFTVAQALIAQSPTEAPKDAAQEASAPAADDDTAAAELAKKLSNPIANLISVPFQFNYDTGIGPKDADKYTLNVQPVVPFTLNKDWNLIVRTIVPVVYQGSMANGLDSEFGLGDTVQSFFFSPKAPTADGWIWGVGPVFLWPTGTDDSLSSEKWGAGPTAVVLKQENGWTYGMLANHISSYAGASDRAYINATFVQPFVSYTTKTYTTLGLNTESSYDWRGEQWTVPLNLSVSQLLKIGGKPMQFSLGYRYYADKPDGGPDWGLRFAVILLFPK